MVPRPTGAPATVSGFLALQGRDGAGSSRPGCCAEPAERGGEVGGPGPVLVEPELPAPAGADQAGGDGGDAVAETPSARTGRGRRGSTGPGPRGGGQRRLGTVPPRPCSAS